MECPYKKECATFIYWKEKMVDFISEVCDTDEHEWCTHYTFSLKPQHDEREKLYGDPHFGEPDWDRLAGEIDCKYFGKKVPHEAPSCNGDCDNCPIIPTEGPFVARKDGWPYV